ncbi:hypothetical protein BU14_0345s0012 [Porphyra umbilicalis]|uniref:Uncharacterized protein n=1 Tax=Porphyra umbilicalis TaxID=2786 RepID=A0A1X6NY62_PORUM|nr:hypothetical protein BU14_0345s0012 [Porphyra umbilicalis]|eukprot:OSX73480.1 hypothetical protein BU14_0345s0012 [Porphyra umbilicalis]
MEKKTADSTSRPSPLSVDSTSTLSSDRSATPASAIADDAQLQPDTACRPVEKASTGTMTVWSWLREGRLRRRRHVRGRAPASRWRGTPTCRAQCPPHKRPAGARRAAGGRPGPFPPPPPRRGFPPRPQRPGFRAELVLDALALDACPSVSALTSRSSCQLLNSPHRDGHKHRRRQQQALRVEQLRATARAPAHTRRERGAKRNPTGRPRQRGGSCRAP